MKVIWLVGIFWSVVLSGASRRQDQYANDGNTRGATDRHASGCAHEILRRLKRGYWQAVPTIATPAIIFQPIIPSEYPVSRPYFIPVWGGNGRVPIYYPPVPGYPDDPRNSYLPPKEYLPPVPVTTTTKPVADDDDDDQPTFIGNRMKDDDDAPIWGEVPSVTQRPAAAPTRRSMRTTTFPPLVHQNRTSGISLSRPQVFEVPPSSIFFDGGTNAGVRPNSGGRPNINRPTNFNRPANRPAPASNLRPPVTTTPPPPPQAPRQQPSRCVWAVISCCNPASKDVSYSCFEQLGCTGAFWDNSPCETDFARAAIEAAANYFSTK